MHLPFYPQRPGEEVQVIPLERQDLATVQVCGQLQQQKLVVSVLLGLNQQPLDFLGSRHFHFSGSGGRELAAVRGVAEDQLFSLCPFAGSWSFLRFFCLSCYLAAHGFQYMS